MMNKKPGVGKPFSGKFYSKTIGFGRIDTAYSIYGFILFKDTYFLCFGLFL